MFLRGRRVFGIGEIALSDLLCAKIAEGREDSAAAVFEGTSVTVVALAGAFFLVEKRDTANNCNSSIIKYTFIEHTTSAERKTALTDANVTNENIVKELVGRKLLMYRSHNSQAIKHEERLYINFVMSAIIRLKVKVIQMTPSFFIFEQSVKSSNVMGINTIASRFVSRPSYYLTRPSQ